MPNYSLTINSQFRPFSYQELLHPVMMATQAQQDLENQYGELAAKANIWDIMANEQTDSYAYKMYETYANDLENQANQLAREGLNAASRRDMLNMRARYSKEIIPIEQAYAARAKEAEEQRVGKAQGMIYEGDAATSSLNRYLNNNTVRYNAANSQEGFKRLATAASALAKRLQEYGRGKPIDAYTNTFLQEHGYRPSEINQVIKDLQSAIQGNPNIRGNGVLESLLANEMQTSGVNTWKNAAARNDYFNRVAPALYQAVGQTQVNTIENYGARLNAQEAMQTRAENRRHQHAMEEAGVKNGNGTLPSLRHWEGVLADNGFDSKVYKNILSKLTVNGRGLQKSYTNGNGKFINPMKVYEEIIEYAKKHPAHKRNNGLSATSLYRTSAGIGGGANVDISMSNAINEMKKKYGVSSILTADEYKAMKNLGFNSKSTFTDMYSTKIADAINSKMQLNRASSINMGDIGYVSDIIRGNMSRGNDIYDIDTKEKLEYSDFDSKVIDDDFIDIAYNRNHRGKILLMIGDRRVAVPAEYLSPEAKKLINYYESLMDQTNIDSEKARAQDMLSSELGILTNSFNKSRTRTSSKI